MWGFFSIFSPISINFTHLISPLYIIDDLSAHRNATQKNTYSLIGYDAVLALDRNTETCMRTNPLGGTAPDTNTWWKVDLGGIHSIYKISIIFKNYEGK